jgi:epoxyqueuosine reductase
MDATRLALELALETGFDLAGVAPLGPPPDLARLDAWLAAGRNGGLDWIARDRDRIADPRGLLPRGRAMLVVGLGHSRPAGALEDGTRVARYALGRDYHNVVGRKLRRLRSRLVEARLFARSQPFRKVVDAGPLMERSHAAQAGLGFASKAANLLHPRFGPWFFLGELLVECELEPTPAPPAGSCGTCRLCLDACPTQAIVAPGVVDARRCISHLTIEHEGPVPEELRAAVGPWAFGCDVCSEVCPWGRGAPDLSERFGDHRALEGGALAWLAERDEARFAERTNGSPLARPGRAGLARNAALALASAPGDASRDGLLAALEHDPSGVVREAAAWSLAHSHASDRGVREALGRAAAREPDGELAARMARHAGAGA